MEEPGLINSIDLSSQSAGKPDRERESVCVSARVRVCVCMCQHCCGLNKAPSCTLLTKASVIIGIE